jgi:two-component system cell cycle response regulator DivK
MTVHRVLVVEDNERNLKLVRDVLQYAGFVVLEARTGERGVELAGQYRPHLILMDLKLPGIGGEQALRLIRDDERTRGIPVIAVTASVMQQDRDRVLEAGFDGYLGKPISVRALPGQVLEFLTRKEPSQ